MCRDLKVMLKQKNKVEEPDLQGEQSAFQLGTWDAQERPPFVGEKSVPLLLKLWKVLNNDNIAVGLKTDSLGTESNFMGMQLDRRIGCQNMFAYSVDRRLRPGDRRPSQGDCHLASSPRERRVGAFEACRPRGLRCASAWQPLPNRPRHRERAKLGDESSTAEDLWRFRSTSVALEPITSAASWRTWTSCFGSGTLSCSRNVMPQELKTQLTFGRPTCSATRSVGDTILRGRR